MREGGREDLREEGSEGRSEGEEKEGGREGCLVVAVVVAAVVLLPVRTARSPSGGLQHEQDLCWHTEVEATKVSRPVCAPLVTNNTPSTRQHWYPVQWIQRLSSAAANLGFRKSSGTPGVRLATISSSVLLALTECAHFLTQHFVIPIGT